MSGGYGWDIKSPGTAATRVSADSDGRVTVEWEMGDPAGHTRVRQYQLEAAERTPGVKRISQEYRPTAASLAYPGEPLQVLRAAFVARWFGLADELPRYFASPEAARAFQADDRISEPNYGPGTVTFARVTGEKRCDVQTTPAALAADGTAPFLAHCSGCEWMANAWGTVAFGTDAAGRPVIRSLTLDGACEVGE